MSTTEIKEHPMLFAGRLAQAVHDGSKTQTRRPITAKNATVLGYPGRQWWHHLLWERGVRVDHSARSETGTPWDGRPLQAYDYLHVKAWNPVDGQVPADDDDLCAYRVRPTIYPGEMIWVRETWHPGDGTANTAAHRAEPTYRTIEPWDVWHESPHRWFPSIHMPRWACRTVLEVTNVRAEQIKELRAADVVAEGFPFHSDLDQFKATWNDLYRGEHSWDANPWVWVYEIKKV